MRNINSLINFYYSNISHNLEPLAFKETILFISNNLINNVYWLLQLAIKKINIVTN